MLIIFIEDLIYTFIIELKQTHPFRTGKQVLVTNTLKDDG